MPQNPHAAQHTHTAWQNEYFVLTDNKNFPSVGMRAKDRWKSALHTSAVMAMTEHNQTS